MSSVRDTEQAVSRQGNYAGAVTRLAAFVLDQSIATLVYALGTAAVVWILTLVTDGSFSWRPSEAIVAVGYLVWLFCYYAYPWSVSGKTVGMAALGIRVVSANGSPTRPLGAALRTVSLPLSFMLLGLGFVPILTGRHRRALHDRIAGTAVVYSWDARAARLRFLARQAPGDQVPVPSS